MSQKSDLYNALKASGNPLSTSYALYTVDQLQAELAFYQVPVVTIEDEPAPAEAVLPEEQAIADQYARFDTAAAATPVAPADPEEMPGQRLNTQLPDEAIRVDENGRVWYQEEVLKPAYPKPRGRRVLTYMDRGVVTETVQNGEYIETFEVAGKGAGKPAEVKITLPSYQVGIYKDPRFPFKIHCYNGREGFNLFEVAEYFGGSELVPEEVKRVYIENDLCYDIRTVVRAIQTEYRQLQLTGRVK
ncbi:MAG: hypothetical protein ACOYB3_02035 [Azonexus sp.]